jgi:hypothetical protein
VFITTVEDIIRHSKYKLHNAPHLKKEEVAGKAEIYCLSLKLSHVPISLSSGERRKNNEKQKSC